MSHAYSILFHQLRQIHAARNQPDVTERLREVVSEGAAPRIIGASRPMRELFDHIALAARSVSTVLVITNRGRARNSSRGVQEMSGREGAFVPVNYAAIPAE